MIELAKKGKSIIMISSEMPELLGISDRIMVMCEGRVTGILNKDEADEVNIALIVILYSGISNLKEKKSYDPYSFAITYTIANFLTTYIIIKIALSHFLTLLITDVMSFL